ncbi:MAG: N-acetylmannosamine-6-phosphate 2-epimerase [Traorella sp.]
MANKKLLDDLRGKVIVSCQANEDINPFNHPEEMVKMAKAGVIGGCVGFRANKPENVKAIKEAFPELPIIGIWKVVTEGCDVYITPTMKEVDVLVELNSDIIAVDGTDRLNCEGRKAYELIRDIKKKYPNQLVMADIATVKEAHLCHEAGADIISTTLSGYTADTLDRYALGCDFELISQIRKEIPDAFINAEGRIWTREEALQAYKSGADVIVIGTAITNPMMVTKRFVNYIQENLG